MYGHQTGGLFAAAILGFGTTASQPMTARSVAGQVGRQLASTGMSTTGALVVVAVVLLVAGMLLVGLARRHTVTA